MTNCEVMEQLTSQGRLSDFVTLCRDANPDIPILKEARAEYANLQ
jgi:hypothetical protein